MITTIFEVPIINLQVQDWATKKQKLFNLIKLTNSTINLKDTVYTDYFSDRHNYVNNIDEIFAQELGTIVDLLKQPMRIDNCWFEVAKQHNYHAPHNHSTIGYSCVCYIQFNKQLHSSVNIIAPFSNFITGNCIDYTPEISEGSLICFPSALLHYTEPNTSEIDRIVVSFNLRPK